MKILFKAYYDIYKVGKTLSLFVAAIIWSNAKQLI